ncbi:tyrosine-type recombinase/integrase, partial [Bacteroides xylanisolvens]
FNNNLKDLARTLHLQSPVTSYTLRHSWATTAKYRGVSIEMISESLGHKSIKTTQIYLKGFELKERTEVNKGNLSYVRNCCVGRSKSVKF